MVHPSPWRQQHAGRASGRRVLGGVYAVHTHSGEMKWNVTLLRGVTRCTETFCHGKEEKLSLDTPDEAHKQLFEVKAAGELCASTDMQRIKPGSPDESLLLAKLQNEPPCGLRMPIGGTLSQKQIDQIKTWIEAGAGQE